MLTTLTAWDDRSPVSNGSGPEAIEREHQRRMVSLRAEGVTAILWENVAECTVTIASTMCVMCLQDEPVVEFTDLSTVAPGSYRLRVHDRGRDLNWDMDVSEPTEDYWVQLWAPVMNVDHSGCGTGGSG